MIENVQKKETNNDIKQLVKKKDSKMQYRKAAY